MAAKAEEIKEEEIKEETEGAKEEEMAQTAKEENAIDQAVEESENSLKQEEVKEENNEKSEKGAKGFFKKKEKKDKKDEKDEKIEELNDKYLRLMAEFDNFRKRTEKEKSQMFEIGARDIVEKILPVIDNFERGLSAATEEEKQSAFVQGIEKIYKQLVTCLESAGVKPIEAVGKEFNPDFHNAVMHVEDETLGENMVAEEFQKGYMYRDTVIRHSMVKVAN